MTERIRVAVAGAGAVAQAVHLPLLARRRDLFDVVGLCDLSAELRDSVGGQWGVPRRFADIGGMLDAVEPVGLILLTSGSHAPAAAEALRRDVAVFCEKPLAYTEDEADLLARVEAASGASLLLGYMKERDAAVRRLAEHLDGVTGVRAVDVRVLHPAGESQLAFANLRPAPADIPAETIAQLAKEEERLLDAALGADTPARFRRLYSSVVVSSLIHDTSLLRALFGGLDEVGDVRVWPDETFPPSVEVAGTLPGGARARMSWHFLPEYPAYEETLMVHHATGSLRVTFGTPYLLNAPTRFEVIGPDSTTSTYLSPTSSFENELVEFHAMVTAGARPVAGIAEGRADIVTSQRIMKRLAEQTGVAIGGEAVTR